MSPVDIIAILSYLGSGIAKMVSTRATKASQARTTRARLQQTAAAAASPGPVPAPAAGSASARPLRRKAPVSVANGTDGGRKKTKPTPVEPARLILLPEETVAQFTTVPAPRLPFDLREAVSHLTKADARFTKLIAGTTLKPYTELEEGKVEDINVWKYLGHSILGQQISWKAARSVIYKFCRLFFPSLPETPNFDPDLGAVSKRDEWPWPTPHQVLSAREEDFRKAGLSGQKVKYIVDAARHFAEGRLDAKALITLPEDEAIESLVRIKGVGVWTAEMLLMFALRLPNLLPVGDLGIQRGMLHFFTCTAPEEMVVHPGKTRAASGPAKTSETAKLAKQEARVQATVEASENLGPGGTVGAPPSPQTISTTLPPLPEGLTLATLRSRAGGNKVKGQYLTPDEMRKLAAGWAPYRSIAAYLMYALKD